MFNLYIIIERLNDIQKVLEIKTNIQKKINCNNVFFLSSFALKDHINPEKLGSSILYFKDSPLECIDLTDSCCEFIFLTNSSEVSLENRINEQIDFMSKRPSLDVSYTHFFISKQISKRIEYTNINLLSLCFRTSIVLNSRDPKVICNSFDKKNTLDMPVLTISKRSAFFYDLGCLSQTNRLKKELFPLELGYSFGFPKAKGFFSKNERRKFNILLDEILSLSCKINVVFLPFPGNGGADYSNLDIFRSKNFSEKNTICFYEGPNSEITEKQESEYNSNFLKFFYLNNNDNRLFCKLLLRKLRRNDLLSEVCVYASKTGYHYISKLNSSKCNTKNTVILHNRLVNGWMGESIKHLCDIDQFCVISDKIKRHLLCYGFSDDKIDVKYLDYRYENLCRSTTKPNDNIIRLGFIGRLSKEKGISKLPELAAKLVDLGHQNFEFHIIGSGGDTINLLNSIGENQLGSYFRFHGYIKDPLPLLENLSGLLIVSEIEGIPLVLMEAIALSIPVFSTPVGEVPDFKMLRNYDDTSLYITKSFNNEDISRDFYKWYLNLAS